MKICKEYFPNPDILEIHTDKDLTGYAYDSMNLLEGMGRTAGDPTLAEAIKTVNGVVKVDIAELEEGRYTVRIEKGKVFKWKKMESEIIEMLRKVLTPRSKKITVLSDRQNFDTESGNFDFHY